MISGVLFDLDNTLIEPVQHLGSDQWVTHKLEHLTKQGISTDDALKEVIPCYLEVMARSQMRPVDPAIPDLLQKMQKKQVPMIGLIPTFMAVHLLAIVTGVWWSLLIALLCSLGWNTMLWLWRKHLSARLPLE